MRKHDCAILTLFFLVGAVVGLIIAGFGFVAWMDAGFVIESKYSANTQGRSGLAVLLVGLVAAAFCAGQVSILGRQSEDDAKNDGKHDCSILALLFMIGAVVCLIIAGFGFVAWMDAGFAIESKYSSQTPGLSGVAVILMGLVASFFCAAQAGILMKQSGDNSKDDKD